MNNKLIRFDWALKKLLRHKANFAILEGFLSELLHFDVTIESILESEGNKENEYDKFNRVDVLVRSQNKELMLVEVQNESENDYFHRMLYGSSKLITEYIKQGEPYGTIKKVYSINIVYFGLGQGADYIYEYKSEFVGIHYKDILSPNDLQKKLFNIENVSDIFPKYFILKVNNFNDIAKNTLDEWIYFFKNSEVKDEFKAKGLDKAKERLRYENLSEEQKKMYDRFQDNIRIENSVISTAKLEREVEIAKNAILEGASDDFIFKITGLSHSFIQKMRKELDT
jgi:predicted transposase/invertase (TIGR01784 family)